MKKKKIFTIPLYNSLLQGGIDLFLTYVIWPSKDSVCLFRIIFTFPIFSLCLWLLYVHNMSTNDLISLVLPSDLTVPKPDTRGTMVLISFSGSHSISSIVKFHGSWLCYELYIAPALFINTKEKSRKEKKSHSVISFLIKQVEYFDKNLFHSQS